MAEDERNEIMKEVRNELDEAGKANADPVLMTLSYILVELRLLRRELGELGEWRSELGEPEPESQGLNPLVELGPETCPGCGVSDGAYHSSQCPVLHNPPAWKLCPHCGASGPGEHLTTCLSHGPYPVSFAEQVAHHLFRPDEDDPEACRHCQQPRSWHPAPARVIRAPVLDPEPENARVDGADAAVSRATVVNAAEGYVDAIERQRRLQALQAGLHPDEDPRKKLP